MVCGHCGTPLTACWSKGQLTYHPYYLCRQRGCAVYGKSIRRSVIEGDFERLLQGMQPSAHLFKAARAMFMDLWDHRLATGAERTKALKAELAKVKQQVEQFLDRIADASIPSVVAAYENRIKALEDRKIVLAENIAKTGRPVRSFDETVRTAFEFLASPCKLWASARLEDKRTVLKLAFTDRLVYVRNEGFRTPSFSLPFKALSLTDGQGLQYGAPGRIRTSYPLVRSQVLYPDELRAQSRKRLWPVIERPEKLARPEGFEPPTPWFVARYSIQMSYGRFLLHCEGAEL